MGVGKLSQHFFAGRIVNSTNERRDKKTTAQQKWSTIVHVLGNAHNTYSRNSMTMSTHITPTAVVHRGWKVGTTMGRVRLHQRSNLQKWVVFKVEKVTAEPTGYGIHLTSRSHIIAQGGQRKPLFVDKCLRVLSCTLFPISLSHYTPPPILSLSYIHTPGHMWFLSLSVIHHCAYYTLAAFALH